MQKTAERWRDSTDGNTQSYLQIINSGILPLQIFFHVLFTEKVHYANLHRYDVKLIAHV